MKRPLIRHAQRIFNTPLLITKGKLDSILFAIGPRLGVDSEQIEVSADGLPDKPRASYPGAVWSDDANYAVTPRGTGIIPIHGTLVRRADWMDSASGLRSYESIRADLRAAIADGNVKRILLDVDSYGGEVDDCFDLATLIYSMRGTKRIDAFANSYAFSAGYALASAAQTVTVTQTGGVGSIGVICEHCDQSGFDAKVGVKYTTIFAGAHKNDYSSHAPLSDGVLAQAQKEIDRTYGIFVSQVARNRGISEAAARETEAGLFYGDEAVTAGLADRVANFDELMAALEKDSPAVASGLTASAANAPQAATSAGTEGVSMPKAEAKGKAADEADPMSAADEAGPTTDDEAQADPVTDEEDEQEEAEKEIAPMPEETKQNASAVAPPANAAAQIARMCSIAGKADLIADFLGRGLTLDAAMEELQAARVGEQPVLSAARRSPSTDALAEIESQAKAYAAQHGTTKAKAFTQALQRNPQAYTEYLRANPVLDGGKTAQNFAQ